MPTGGGCGSPYASRVGTDEQAGIARALALGLLRDAEIGQRVVVRAHAAGGARDALGDLVARTADSVTVDTRRGLVEVALEDVVAAKRVPPPPPPRPRGPHVPR